MKPVTPLAWRRRATQTALGQLTIVNHTSEPITAIDVTRVDGHVVIGLKTQAIRAYLTESRVRDPQEEGA